ncbi:MAG: hypothetical protein ACI856_001984 [Kiritimatiellia bacterium]|jgi:hypothetical protein
MVAFAHSRNRTPARTSVRAHTPWGSVQLSGYRYYSAELGRWPSHDPLEEIAFRLLDEVIRTDPLGAPFLDGLMEMQKLALKPFASGFGLYQFVRNTPFVLADRLGTATVGAGPTIPGPSWGQWRPYRPEVNNACFAGCSRSGRGRVLNNCTTCMINGFNRCRTRRLIVMSPHED